MFAKARNLALGALRQAARFRFLLEASVRQSSAENESHQPLFLSHLRCASPLPRLLQRQHPMHGSLLYLAEHLSIPAVYQDECVVGCACSHQSPADSSRTPFISSKTMLSPSEDRHESARRRRNSARSSSSGEGSAARCARCSSTTPCTLWSAQVSQPGGQTRTNARSLPGRCPQERVRERAYMNCAGQRARKRHKSGE